jgi:hypothetical protein
MPLSVALSAPIVVPLSVKKEDSCVSFPLHSAETVKEEVTTKEANK